MTLMGGTALGAVIFEACGVPAEEQLVQAPLEMPEDLVSGLDNWYATLCRQCRTSEGLVVRVMEGRAKKVEGNVNYPINAGKHSARCEAGLQALYNPDRIAGPMVRLGNRGEGRWDEISWTDAIARVTHQLQELQRAGDQSGMALVTDSVGAQLGMVAERFASKFGGRHLRYEPQETTNLRAAIKGVFDQDVLPDFDIANSSYLLSFGADFLSTWLSPVRYSVGYGNFRQGERERGTMVHVEPRFSMTAASADEWVYVKPGQEGLLALSIAEEIISAGLEDKGAASDLTAGLDIDRYAPVRMAEAVGVSADRIKRLAHEFAEHRPALAIGGGSAGAHTNGAANLAAIYSLNYLVGSVGKEGGLVFNPAGELAGVAPVPAPSSFEDIQGLVSDMRSGAVKALLVRGANLAYGLPSAAKFKEATAGVPLIVSFASIIDDTTAMADIVLPEHSYLEDWGADLPNPGPGHAIMGLQQPVVRPFFESRGAHLGTKGFGDTLLTFSQLLGLEMDLPGATFKDILQDGARQLFESGRGAPRAGDFRTFWNTLLQRGGWWDRAATYSGPAPQPKPLPDIENPSFLGSEANYPFHLLPFESNALTDGSGAHLPWLQGMPDPITTAAWQTWMEINAKTAEKLDIHEGDIVKLESPNGSIEALAYPHPAVAPDVVCVPMGLGHENTGRYASGRGANVQALLDPVTDRETGALAWSATRVSLTKTGRWTRLPRFENTAPGLSTDEEQHIIELTPVDS